MIHGASDRPPNAVRGADDGGDLVLKSEAGIVRHSGRRTLDMLRLVPNVLRITQALEDRIDPLGLRQGKPAARPRDYVGPHMRAEPLTTIGCGVHSVCVSRNARCASRRSGCCDFGTTN